LLAEFSSRWRAEWKRLLGLSPSLRAAPGADDWVRREAGRLLPCLPASGRELAELLGQLGLAWG